MNLFRLGRGRRISESYSDHSDYGSRQDNPFNKGSLRVVTDEETGLSRFIRVDSTNAMDVSGHRKKISNACKALKLKFNRKSQTGESDYIQSTWNCCCKSSDKDIYSVYQKYTSFPPFKTQDQLFLKNYSHLL